MTEHEEFIRTARAIRDKAMMTAAMANSLYLYAVDGDFEKADQAIGEMLDDGLSSVDYLTLIKSICWTKEESQAAENS
jgi:pentatricopeptide repeat protein